jgi:hypothetical protein
MELGLVVSGSVWLVSRLGVPHAMRSSFDIAIQNLFDIAHGRMCTRMRWDGMAWHGTESRKRVEGVVE